MTRFFNMMNMRVYIKNKFYMLTMKDNKFKLEVSSLSFDMATIC